MSTTTTATTTPTVSYPTTVTHVYKMPFDMNTKSADLGSLRAFMNALTGLPDSTWVGVDLHGAHIEAETAG